MNRFFALLNRYNRREQMALLSLALAVAIFLVWAIVLAPIQSKRNQVAAANTAATQTLGKVQLMTAQIQQMRSMGAQAGSGDNISGLVDSSLRENGISMTGFQPGTGGEVRVRLDKASYSALMQWLYDIESKHGINVRDLSIASTNDPGVVTVNVRLQKSQ